MERPAPDLIKAWKEKAADYVYEKFAELLKGKLDEDGGFFWITAPVIGGASQAGYQTCRCATN
jgi:hypothetical protein